MVVAQKNDVINKQRENLQAILKAGGPGMLSTSINGLNLAQTALNKQYIDNWIKPAESSGKIAIRDKNGQTKDYNINDLAHNNRAVMEEAGVKSAIDYWTKNP